ncbi:MAG: TetR/AcrR family transcriptional regulator [Deltaproteobacteria bacterium]|nr:TetR/AcrR family transcriptional regulator [Deltaproteobacteria bacterium]MBW1987841.1 TetR/AcrR family transcriptional regulator [Deltaproteobacteria bacterium]
MPGKKLSRREREKLRQRRQLLAAAQESFSERGYHNVSMHEIAEKAEFAIGTIYKFFRNKEHLYKSLIRELADSFHETLSQALEAADDEIDQLRNYVMAKSTLFKDNISIIRLYFAETRGASFNIRAGLDSEIRERYGLFLRKLASVFDRGIQKNRFKKIADPYHLAVALDSLTNAFLFLWLETPEQHPYPDNPDVILNILFKGLVNS